MIFWRHDEKILIGLLALGSVSAFAADTASLEYSCELDGEKRTGKVQIDDKLIVGEPSFMFFGKGTTLCFRFERHVKINDIYLALRNSDQLRSGLDSSFISLGNITFSESGTSIKAINMGLIKKELLRCSYSNVNWKH